MEEEVVAAEGRRTTTANKILSKKPFDGCFAYNMGSPISSSYGCTTIVNPDCFGVQNLLFSEIAGHAVQQAKARRSQSNPAEATAETIQELEEAEDLIETSDEEIENDLNPSDPENAISAIPLPPPHFSPYK